MPPQKGGFQQLLRCCHHRTTRTCLNHGAHCVHCVIYPPRQNCTSLVTSSPCGPTHKCIQQQERKKQTPRIGASQCCRSSTICSPDCCVHSIYSRRQLQHAERTYTALCSTQPSLRTSSIKALLRDSSTTLTQFHIFISHILFVQHSIYKHFSPPNIICKTKCFSFLRHELQFNSDYNLHHTRRVPPRLPQTSFKLFFPPSPIPLPVVRSIVTPLSFHLSYSSLVRFSSFNAVLTFNASTNAFAPSSPILLAVTHYSFDFLSFPHLCSSSQPKFSVVNAVLTFSNSLIAFAPSAPISLPDVHSSYS